MIIYDNGNIITIYIIYIMIYWNIKCLFKMAERDTLQVYLSSKKPRISVKTVQEKQNRNMDLQLELPETIMSK